MTTSNEFYTSFADHYSAYAAKKIAYLSTIDTVIVSENVRGSSMADVGSGTGTRAQSLAQTLGMAKLTLIDESAGMINLLKQVRNANVIRADISDKQFDCGHTYRCVTCLWNVIGHIPTEVRRIQALNNMAQMLDKEGVLFIDVNNRYNVAHYGLFSVVKNILKDLLRMGSGDFDLTMETDGGLLQTRVHLFSPREMDRLIARAGLKIEKRFVVDYCSGKLRGSIFSGQLLFKLKKP